VTYSRSRPERAAGPRCGIISGGVIPTAAPGIVRKFNPSEPTIASRREGAPVYAEWGASVSDEAIVDLKDDWPMAGIFLCGPHAEAAGQARYMKWKL